MPCEDIVWDRDDILYGTRCSGREPFLVMLSSKDGIVGDDIKEYARVHREDGKVPPLVDAIYDYGSSILIFEIKRFAHPRAVLGVVKRIREGEKVPDKALPWGSGWKRLLVKMRDPSFVLPRGYEDLDTLLRFVRNIPEAEWKDFLPVIEGLKVRKVSHLRNRLIEKYLYTYETFGDFVKGKEIHYFVVLFAKPLWLSRQDMKIFSFILRQRIWGEIKDKVDSLHIFFQGSELFDVDVFYEHYIGR